MDIAKFKALVTKHGGEEKVASIIFNNAYRHAFTNEKLDYTKHLDEVNEHFVFEFKDPLGVECVIVKPVEYVEGIIFVKDVADLKKLSPMYITG